MNKRFLKTWVLLAGVILLIQPSFGALLFNATFNDAAMATAGLTPGQISSVHTAFGLAEAQFSNVFNDPIHVNITVTATSSAGVLGQSSTPLNFFSFSSILSKFLSDSKSADDAVAAGAGGSVPAADPVGGSHSWLVPKAEAKALGLTADDPVTSDGTFTFGTSFNYDFDRTDGIGAGLFDFQGIAMHEISEIMGRIGGLGVDFGNGTPDYLPFDLFRYSGVGTRGLTNGAGISLSMNAGTNMLKAYNNASVNGGDAQDWASGTNDAFNAFSSSGVINSFSAMDVRTMDIIGYDLTAAVPEPATGVFAASALLLGAFLKRRADARRTRS